MLHLVFPIFLLINLAFDLTLLPSRALVQQKPVRIILCVNDNSIRENIHVSKCYPGSIAKTAYLRTPPVLLQVGDVDMQYGIGTLPVITHGAIFKEMTARWQTHYKQLLSTLEQVCVQEYKVGIYQMRWSAH